MTEMQTLKESADQNQYELAQNQSKLEEIESLQKKNDPNEIA